MDNHDYKNFELLNNVINENFVIIDVGANEGTYTDFFKEKLKGTGKIYSIELFPDTCNLLSMKYVNDKNIHVLNYAISNKEGVIPFYSGNHHCLHNIIGHDVNFNKTEISGEIESKRLDILFKDEKIINLIKIDVEGSELLVLEGCKGIVDKLEFMLIECHLKSDWDKIKKIILEDFNFECINNTFDFKGDIEINKESDLAYQCFCRKKI